MDAFKALNVPKQSCHVCRPFRGENASLRPLKPNARRHARRALKLIDRIEARTVEAA